MPEETNVDSARFGGETLRRFSELTQYTIDPAVAPLLPVEYCLEKKVVILGKLPELPHEPIAVGVINRKDRALVAELGTRLDRRIKAVQLNDFEIRQAISRVFGVRLGEDEKAEELLLLDHERKIDFAPDQPPSKILDDLLSAAVRRRATDIHLECYNNDIDLRFRVDGVMYQITTPLSPDNVVKVISRIKVLCNLDFAERRRAQDGRFSALYNDGAENRRVDFRVSVVPGSYGQEAVIRILDPGRFILDLNGLEFDPGMLARYQRLLRYPNGLILATGPTGSGKTTTLYASVAALQSRNIKIVTVEDPVEYEFPKINQKNVDSFMGFADYLRAFLRQNPDVILVGEVRDAETAETAVRAATTGHLILSTLHTTDALGAIGRLRILGVDDDYLSSILVGVVGQRLVRRVCEACRTEAPLEEDLVPLFYERPPAGSGFKGAGCEECGGTGFRGMVGVYELLQPDRELAAAIGQGKPLEELRPIALQSGYEPLVEDALRKVATGLTTLGEVARRVPPKYPHAPVRTPE